MAQFNLVIILQQGISPRKTLCVAVAVFWIAEIVGYAVYNVVLSESDIYTAGLLSSTLRN